MRYFFFFLMLTSTFFSFAQTKTFVVSGVLLDSEDKTPLESATVHFETINDSTLVTYTITDGKGLFKLEEKTNHKNLNLFISYLGYKTFKKTVSIDKRRIDLGTINLETDTNALDEIIISSRAPITVKKDTLEFNVKSFKTKKDANVEDLLRKLPGVEVDQEGKITANGKDVNRILVNGKPFFGNDPTMATRNLSKDIIEKIQITDTKSNAQAFSGEEVNSENKTINLTIKKENNKGIFARVAAGLGTDERYELAGMFNRFNNDQRLSVLAGGNNINAPGFSFGEIRQMFGGGGNSYRGRRSFGGGQGITTSKTTGIDYADTYGEQFETSGGYVYSGSDSRNQSSSRRENILADTRYFTESNSQLSSSSDSNKFNSEFEFKLDSTLYINVKPSFNFSSSNTESNRDQKSNDINQVLNNESFSSSMVSNEGKSFNNNLSITKKYGSKGSFLRVFLDNSFSNNDSDDFLNSTTRIYEEDPNNSSALIVSREILRDQFREGDNKSNNLSTGITYRLPLKSKELFFDFSYQYVNNKRKNRLSSFNKDGLDNYTIMDSILSTDFEYRDERNIPKLRFSYRKDKLSASFDASYVFRALTNEDNLRPIFDITRHFNNLQLGSYFKYRFSAKSSLDIDYSLTNSPPELTQLQAFEDVTNPLNTVIGNPNLEPSNRHGVSMSFRSFDFQKRTGFFGRLRASFDNNEVKSVSTINDDLERTTTYENVDGDYNINSRLFYRKRIKIDSVKTFGLKFSLGADINNNVNFNNGVEYVSKVNSVSPSIGVEFEWRNVMVIEPEYNLSFTNNSYDLDAFEDEEFVFHRIELNTTTLLPKKLEWRNNINYNYNPNIADGFQKSAWFWNSTLAYTVLNDKGIISIKAYDLLNQNTNARRIATANYIEDSQSTVLQQYFMLNFSWKFNSLKGIKVNNRRGHYRGRRS